ncbi:hypothetical protein EDD29_4719 [Actinocorallia herbida]|uniref:Uncharacterized protein n=1 Tax=Actinocorallia herbida TaxID=58109 RepID=A0A3N1D228_9ACTN|nr:hypothetical protein [Actinocorallia herbida]ROO87128.1 hypothetical protein EDD29_4719 [Actinocorallia herbida]
MAAGGGEGLDEAQTPASAVVPALGTGGVEGVQGERGGVAGAGQAGAGVPDLEERAAGLAGEVEPQLLTGSGFCGIGKDFG